MLSDLSRRAFLQFGAAASAGVLLPCRGAEDRPDVSSTLVPIHLDVLIIGGGVPALLIMRQLESWGYSVALIDRSLGAPRACSTNGYVEGGYSHTDPTVAEQFRTNYSQWEVTLHKIAPRLKRSRSVYGFETWEQLRQRTSLWGAQSQRMPFKPCPVPQAFRGGPICHALVTREYEVDCGQLIRGLASADRAMSKIADVLRIQLTPDSGLVESVDVSISGRVVRVKPAALVLAAGLWNFSLLDLLTKNSPRLRATVRGYQAMRRTFELVIRGPLDLLPPFTGVFPTVGRLSIASRTTDKGVVWRVSDYRSAPLSKRRDAAIFDERWWLPLAIRSLEAVAPSVFSKRKSLLWGAHTTTHAEVSAAPSPSATATTNGVHQFGIRNLWAVWPTNLVFASFSVERVSTEILQRVRARRGLLPSTWDRVRRPLAVAAPQWAETRLTDWSEFWHESSIRSPRGRQPEPQRYR